MKTARSTPCPSCGKKLDAAIDPTDDTAIPSEGDWSVCLYCQEPLLYRADGTLRSAEAADFRFLSQEHPEAFATITQYARVASEAMKDWDKP